MTQDYTRLYKTIQDYETIDHHDGNGHRFLFCLCSESCIFRHFGHHHQPTDALHELRKENQEQRSLCERLKENHHVSVRTKGDNHL